MGERSLIFVDAGALIARYRQTDEYHGAAVLAWRQIERRRLACATSSLVLYEAARFLCRTVGIVAAAGRLRIWLSSEIWTVLRPDVEVELDAIDLLVKYADQQIGFEDCVSFVLIRRHRITRAFTFDNHFAVSGLELWPLGARR